MKFLCQFHIYHGERVPEGTDKPSFSRWAESSCLPRVGEQVVVDAGKSYTVRSVTHDPTEGVITVHLGDIPAADEAQIAAWEAAGWERK